MLICDLRASSASCSYRLPSTDGSRNRQQVAGQDFGRSPHATALAGLPRRGRKLSRKQESEEGNERRKVGGKNGRK
jgi:hypothetical protein